MNQNFFSNFQSLHTEEEPMSSSFQRNMVNDPKTIPQNSRGGRKIDSMDGSANFQYGGGFGSYMPFQSPQMDLRKGMNTTPHVAHNNNNNDYMFQHNAHYQYNGDRNLGLSMPQNSNQYYDRNAENGNTAQRKRCVGVVQQNIQHDQYFFQNFETLNKIAQKEEEINRFMDRNPVNARHDEVKKERLNDKKSFMNIQGEHIVHHLQDLKPTNTRKDTKSTVQQNYIPNGRTMAQPSNLF